MDTGKGERSSRNAKRRLAYASMDAEKKAALLAKKRDSRQHRSQSDCSSSTTPDRLAFDNSGLILLKSCSTVVVCM